MSEKWSDADMARFLDAYENYDVLWNPQIELYRNLQARRAALQAILQHINKPKISEDDLKNKIKNIRTTYNRELAKVKSLKSGSGPDDIYVPVLVWFKQADSFLRIVTTGGRKSQSNMNSQNLPQQTEDSEDTSQQMPHVAETNSQLDIDDANGEENATQDRPQPHLSLNISLRETHQHKPATCATRTTTEIAVATPKTKGLIGKKQKRKICEVSNTSSLDKALSKLENISRRSDIDDEFATFGKHIANQLRQLPLRRALEVQQNFQNTLTQERIEYLNSMALPTHHAFESISERVASHNTTPDDYYSSYTQFSSICSPPPQIPTGTMGMPNISMENSHSGLLAAALANINNENDDYL